MICSSEGNILEDETAILILDHSKTLADEINKKQKVAEETGQSRELGLNCTHIRVNLHTAYRNAAVNSLLLFSLFCVQRKKSNNLVVDISPSRITPRFCSFPSLISQTLTPCIRYLASIVLINSVGKSNIINFHHYSTPLFHP